MKKELAPLIPLDDLKQVVAGLIAVPKPRVSKKAAKPIKRRSKRPSGKKR
jgi:hypothetical protein